MAQPWSEKLLCPAVLGLILAYSVLNVYKLLGDHVRGDCGPICLSGSPFPLVFPSAQRQFCCCCCPNHQLRHLSLGENTITRDVNRKLLKMKFSCRVSASIQVKNVQVTELLEWMFSLPPHLCCFCSTKAFEKKEEALHLLLGSLSLFLLASLWDIQSNFVSVQDGDSRCQLCSRVAEIIIPGAWCPVLNGCPFHTATTTAGTNGGQGQQDKQGLNPLWKLN